MQDINHTEHSIKQQLLTICDQHSGFNDDCAFFCTAASLVMQSYAMELNRASAQGAARFAQRLIEQSQGLNDQLQKILQDV